MIMDLRERARKDWGAGFSLRRFHAALMDLGAAAGAARHRDRARLVRDGRPGARRLAA